MSKQIKTKLVSSKGFARFIGLMILPVLLFICFFWFHTSPFPDNYNPLSAETVAPTKSNEDTIDDMQIYSSEGREFKISSNPISIDIPSGYQIFMTNTAQILCSADMGRTYVEYNNLPANAQNYRIVSKSNNTITIRIKFQKL